MADERRTGVLDDFTRANEDPLSHGGDWSNTATGFANHRLVSNEVIIASGQTNANMYWNQTTVPGDQDIEVWGLTTGGGILSGAAWSIDFWMASTVGGTSVLDGYRMRFEYLTGTDHWRTYQVDNFAPGTVTIIQDTGPGPASQDRFLLFRRIAATATLESWVSDTTDPTGTWTLVHSVVDDTYQGPFYMGLGIADNSGAGEIGWGAYGGGPIGWTPEFMRRPWEYQGVELAT